jgi:hypothetical protein
MTGVRPERMFVADPRWYGRVLRGYDLTKNRDYPPPPLTFVNIGHSFSEAPVWGIGRKKGAIFAVIIYLSF